MALVDRLKFNGGADDIAWKFPDEGITWGAQLIVAESQEAIFFKGGQCHDLFGPGTYTLKSNNIPLLEKFVNMAFGGDTPFAAEVWFISKRIFQGIGWGTKTPIQIEDPKFGILTNLRAFGVYGIRVADTRVFVKEVIGTQGKTTTESIQDLMLSTIVSDIEEMLSQVVHEQNIDIIRINTQRSKIEEAFKPLLAKKFERFGIAIEQFEIESLNIPQDDPGYQALVKAKAERAAKVEQAMGDKAQMDILGQAYAQKRMLDIGEASAKNEGAGGGMMQAGMGMGMGQMMGNMMGQMNVSGQPAADDPAAKIAKLKGMLDQGLISQDEFNAKKAKILESM
ncbi:MAG: SPFH domain-containing protein [Leptospiraceae bacterium]|nr:SPFH domain-containing protein [Leptospiraceae bacterium]